MATLDETRLVGFLEAVFSLEVDDQAWLRQMLLSLSGLCGPEHHYRAFFYDASDVHQLALWNVCAEGTSPEVDAAFERFQSCADARFVTDTFRSLPVGSVRDNGLACMGPVLTELEQHGWGDLFSINGLDPSGIGCMLLIGCRAPMFTPSAAELQLFRRLAANLASAFRCRRRLGGAAPQPSAASARVDGPDELGDVVGVAREQLRSAAPKSGPHSASKRDLPGTALNFSHPSSRARLTLVHTFEESGRRYIVAREHDVQAQGLAALTGRERQIVEHAYSGFSNKQIAYNLGISDATVRVLMARAANRIGVRTRRELLAHPALLEMRPVAQPA